MSTAKDFKSTDLSEIHRELKALAHSQERLRRSIRGMRYICELARHGEADAIARVRESDMDALFEYCEQRLASLALRYAELERLVLFSSGRRLDS